MFIRVALLLILSVFVQACAFLKPVSLGERIERERKVEELIAQSVYEMRSQSPQELSKAEASLLLAKELIPKHPRVIDGLGSIAWRRNDKALAKSYFEKAVEIDPNYDCAYAHLALVAESSGDDAKALELYDTALKLNPLNYRARNNYAVLIAKQNIQWSIAHDKLVNKSMSKVRTELLKAKADLKNITDPVIENNVEIVKGLLDE